MMNKMSKREYLRELKKRYCKASKKRKTQLLNDFCTFTGYHRKSALRLINNRLPSQLGNFVKCFNLGADI